MYAVVNTMTLTRPIDGELASRMQAELMEQAKGVPGFVHATFIATGDDQAVMVIVCDSPQSVRLLHDTVGAPWIRDHVQPQVSAAERRLGPVLATTL